GQRHGFTLDKKKAADEKPRYVIAVDTVANTITVSSDKVAACEKDVHLTDITWTYRFPAETEQLSAQTRYRQKPVGARLLGERVVFDEPIIAPAGQSLVLYRDDVCLGGGIIAPKEKASGLSTAPAVSSAMLPVQ